jgi:hypothetical protein
VSAPSPDLLPLASMLAVLAAIGWGLGLAAALARCSIGARASRRLRISSPTLLGLALLVAVGALVAYLLVLRAVGMVAY